MDSRQLTEYLSLLGKGAVIKFAPSIFRGLLVEALKDKEISVKKVTGLVQVKGVFWDLILPDWKELLGGAGNGLGSLDWLTADWFVNSIKESRPDLASLFLGWEKSRNWLHKQLGLLKEEVK